MENLSSSRPLHLRGTKRFNITPQNSVRKATISNTNINNTVIEGSQTAGQRILSKSDRGEKYPNNNGRRRRIIRKNKVKDTTETKQVLEPSPKSSTPIPNRIEENENIVSFTESGITTEKSVESSDTDQSINEGYQNDSNTESRIYRIKIKNGEGTDVSERRPGAKVRKIVVLNKNVENIGNETDSVNKFNSTEPGNKSNSKKRRRIIKIKQKVLQNEPDHEISNSDLKDLDTVPSLYVGSKTESDILQHFERNNLNDINSYNRSSTHNKNIISVVNEGIEENNEDKTTEQRKEGNAKRNEVGNKKCHQTVSYTHLDVYKRQVLLPT